MMDVYRRAEVMKHIFERECIPLSIKKGIGYGTEKDAFANLRKGGIVGINHRLDDKIARLTNLGEKIKSGDFTREDWESWEDNNRDLINYASFNLILSRILVGRALINPFKASDENKTQEG